MPVADDGPVVDPIMLKVLDAVPAATEATDRGLAALRSALHG
jgi:hypothetical protein